LKWLLWLDSIMLSKIMMQQNTYVLQ
jgi:hypothetical protein